MWLEEFKTNPIEALLTSENNAIIYFTNRDLLSKKEKAIEYIWNLSEPIKILKKQKGDGTWKYPGKKANLFPPHHYSLIETWKKLRILVKRYEFTKEHPNIVKAAEFMFSCQTEEGDIRGMIGNQYATYYTGAMMAVLIRAGYVSDPRIEKGFQWLLSMRQDDKGWTIPILTHNFDKKTIYRLTSENVNPVQPDKSKPFSHNWTDMVLRAFAVHPKYSKSKDARIAGELLKSRFFKNDYYTSYKSAYYWIRFVFWWTNLYTSLDTLSRLGFSINDPDIRLGLEWFVNHQKEDGLWDLTYMPGKSVKENKKSTTERQWLSLNICRMFKRFYDLENNYLI